MVEQIRKFVCDVVCFLFVFVFLFCLLIKKCINNRLMFGDEPELGTPAEDMLSICTVHLLKRVKTKLLVNLGLINKIKNNKYYLNKQK